MSNAIKLCGAVALVLALHASATAGISYTAGAWGPHQFPADITPPSNAPHGTNGYPGDTLGIETYSGDAADWAPGTYVVPMGLLNWTIDYTYGGTETDPDDWSEVTHNFDVTRQLTIGGVTEDIVQSGLLENTWHNDYVTFYDGQTTTFNNVNGYQIDVTPLGFARTAGSSFSGGAPWVQPDIELFAQFVVSDAPVIPVPGAAVLGMLGLGIVGWVQRRAA